MSRMTLALASLLALLFSGVAAVVGGRRYEDVVALRRFIDQVEACEKPCFMGIRLGYTTADEAEKILRASDWVEDVRRTTYTLTWTWSGREPAFIDGDASASMRLDGTGVVQEIRLDTLLITKAVWMAYGTPKAGFAQFQFDSGIVLSHFFTYSFPQITFGAINRVKCPSSIRNFWESPVQISWRMKDAVPYVDNSYPIWWRGVSTC